MKCTTTVTDEGSKITLFGMPAVGMLIPDTVPLSLPQGVYAARATVGEEHYAGMLWYAPDALVGGEVQFTFYPFDTIGFYVSGGSVILLEVVRVIREPKSFAIPEQLVVQLTEDIAHVREVLHM